MENLELIVVIISIKKPREVKTYSGFTHILIEGKVKDDTMTMDLTVWNDAIQELQEVKPGDKVKLSNCFITSFKGVLSVNIGRESTIEKL
jgi:ssDNA-binding replication factor A large subunit